MTSLSQPCLLLLTTSHDDDDAADGLTLGAGVAVAAAAAQDIFNDVIHLHDLSSSSQKDQPPRTPLAPAGAGGTTYSSTSVARQAANALTKARRAMKEKQANKQTNNNNNTRNRKNTKHDNVTHKKTGGETNSHTQTAEEATGLQQQQHQQNPPPPLQHSIKQLRAKTMGACELFQTTLNIVPLGARCSRCRRPRLDHKLSTGKTKVFLSPASSTEEQVPHVGGPVASETTIRSIWSEDVRLEEEGEDCGDGDYSSSRSHSSVAIPPCEQRGFQGGGKIIISGMAVIGNMDEGRTDEQPVPCRVYSDSNCTVPSLVDNSAASESQRCSGGTVKMTDVSEIKQLNDSAGDAEDVRQRQQHALRDSGNARRLTILSDDSDAAKESISRRSAARSVERNAKTRTHVQIEVDSVGISSVNVAGCCAPVINTASDPPRKPISSKRLRDSQVVTASLVGFDAWRPGKINQDCAFASASAGDQATNLKYFGVADGHGDRGEWSAQMVATALASELGKLQRMDPILLKNVIEGVVVSHNMRAERAGVNLSFCGTTLVFGVVDEGTLHIGNIGDSRAVLCRRRRQRSHTEGESGALGDIETVPLTWDHKPSVSYERHRLERAGARVTALEVGGSDVRIWMPDVDVPGLGTSRSIGDELAKNLGVISDADITVHRLCEDDLLVICASDGVFEFLENDEVSQIVLKCLSDGHAPEAAARALVQAAHKKWRDIEKDAVDDCSAALLVI